MKAEITIHPADEPEEVSPRYLSSDFGFQVRIDGKLIGHGTSWVHCGWLAPGSHADLDGSGLALWGDSQPGGWTTVWGDGQMSGKLTVRAFDDDQPHDPIRITDQGECGDCVEIIPDDVPEWSAAIEQWRNSDRDVDGKAWKTAMEARNKVIESLEEAVEQSRHDIPTAPEPGPEEIQVHLNQIYIDAEATNVWIGWWGGAPHIVWEEEDGELDHEWWPSEERVREIVRSAGESVADRMISDAADEAAGVVAADPAAR